MPQCSLKFAANLTMMFTEVPFLERFAAAARAGFRGVEYQRPYEWPVDEIAAAQRAAGVETVLINTPSGDWAAGERGIACLPGREEEFRHGVEEALKYAEALGVERIHATAGLGDGISCHQTFVENVKWFARRASGRMVLIEAISRQAFPGYFLTSLEQAAAVMEEVGEPNVWLQIDCFHLQLSAGNVTNHLRRYLPLAAHVQIAGVPERHEPDTGELHYEHVFRVLSEQGYEGWIGCEYNPAGRTEDGLGWLRRATSSEL